MSGRKRARQFGVKNQNAKLNDDQIRAIRRLRKAGESREVLAKLFNVSPFTVAQIYNRHAWKHVKDE